LVEIIDIRHFNFIGRTFGRHRRRASTDRRDLNMTTDSLPLEPTGCAETTRTSGRTYLFPQA
jgi:hypothetical protein